MNENIIVVGIGGSNLGTMAIWQALRGRDEKMLFADTFDARNLKRILEKTVHPATIIIVSKSGTTSETIANAAVLLQNAAKDDKIVAITDEDSKLWNWAGDKGLARLEVPKELGGRYSVFSNVGMYPLGLAGIDTVKLLKGMESASESAAEKSAEMIYKNYQDGKIIHDLFLFEPDLEGVGKWWRQLFGESLGKDGRGITPTVSIGTTDLHSVGQLYLGGPKDKFTTFVSVKNHGADFEIPESESVSELVDDLGGKKFSEALATTLAGVKKAYQKAGLPFAEIELPEISEESLGKFMEERMLEVKHLGELMGVNPFDQPQVEMYKEETRKLLKKL